MALPLHLGWQLRAGRLPFLPLPSFELLDCFFLSLSLPFCCWQDMLPLHFWVWMAPDPWQGTGQVWVMEIEEAAASALDLSFPQPHASWGGSDQTDGCVAFPNFTSLADCQTYGWSKGCPLVISLRLCCLIEFVLTWIWYQRREAGLSEWALGWLPVGCFFFSSFSACQCQVPITPMLSSDSLKQASSPSYYLEFLHSDLGCMDFKLLGDFTLFNDLL